jgi:hypothetical protein
MRPMVAASPERTAVLVIRAWIEGEPPTLRMRITHTLDVSLGEDESTAAASVDEACAIVRRWLEELSAR